MKEKINELIAERMGLSIYSPFQTVKTFNPENKKTTLKTVSYFEFYLEVENQSYDALSEQRSKMLDKLKNTMNHSTYETYVKREAFKHEYSENISFGKLLDVEARRKRAEWNALQAVKRRRREIDDVLYASADKQINALIVQKKISQEQLNAINDQLLGDKFDWCLNAFMILGIVNLKSTGMYSPVFTQERDFVGLHKKQEDKPPIQEDVEKVEDEDEE